MSVFEFPVTFVLVKNDLNKYFMNKLPQHKCECTAVQASTFPRNGM